MRFLRKAWRWASALDQLREARGELAAALKALDVERLAVARLEAEKAAQARELRMYRKYAGQIDEARTQLGLGEGR